MDYKHLIKSVFKEIDLYAPLAIDLNNYLADNPEISGSEYNSCCKIIELLSSNGIEVIHPLQNNLNAFNAKISKSKNYKYKAAILVEYDALPEIGHACGHCTSAAISILSGLALNKFDLPIEINLIGTPDEEVSGFKTTLVKNGVFDDCDIAIMIHMDNENKIATRLLSILDCEVVFKGKCSHASAAPWEGKNALNGLQLFFHAVDMLRQHVKPDVRIHGIITDGGKAANIVPELAKAYFYIRSKDFEYLYEVYEMVKNCAKGAAISTGTEVELNQLFDSYSNLVPNETGEKLLEKIYLDLNLLIHDTDEKPFGSSDVGNVSQVCPTFHPTLSIIDNSAALHTREFAEAVKGDSANKAIINGAKIISQFLIELLHNESLFKKIKEDFINNKKGE